MAEAVSLKEYIDQRFVDKNKADTDRFDAQQQAVKDALIAQEKAVAAALAAVKEEGRKTEVSAEKRFELLNELRVGVATKEQLEALEKVVEDLKTSRDTGAGRNGGLNAGWTILLGIVSLISALVIVFFTISGHIK